MSAQDSFAGYKFWLKADTVKLASPEEVLTAAAAAAKVKRIGRFCVLKRTLRKHALPAFILKVPFFHLFLTNTAPFLPVTHWQLTVIVCVCVWHLCWRSALSLNYRYRQFKCTAWLAVSVSALFQLVGQLLNCLIVSQGT